MQATEPTVKVSRVCQKILDDLDKYPITEWTNSFSGLYTNEKLNYQFFQNAGYIYVYDLQFNPRESRIISDKASAQLRAKQLAEQKNQKLKLISKIIPDENPEQLLAEMEKP